ncbi:MAG TPA: hypothetical protein VIH61_00740 [Waddliaceae bacterium]
MTIYLPDNIQSFRQAFNETCDRILRSEHDETFFKLVINLTAILKGHFLTKDYFEKFENEYSKSRQEYIAMASNILEYNWKKLWQYHRHHYDHRKQLVSIRRIVTAPNAMESPPLYPRALSNMWQFRYSSPFFRCIVEARFLFRTAQSQVNLWPFLGKQFCTDKDQVIKQIKVAVVKLKKNDRKKDKIYQLSAGIKQKETIPDKVPTTKKKASTLLKRSIEPLSSLYSPQATRLEQKFGIHGRNSDEKRRHMLSRAETDPFFCLERFRFLEQCLNAPSCLPPLQRPIKRKKKIDQKMWISAFERCEREALWYAKAAFLQQNTSNQHMDAFVSCEYEIRRKDFEKYLSALKNHIHAYLYQIEKNTQNVDDDPSLALPGTLKEDFVKKIGRKYWKNHPQAKLEDAFLFYQCECPLKFQLKWDRWYQIIREYKIDPRERKDKVRSCGKKTCKI